MSDFKILVAGVGNIFFGDDGFGVEVVKRLRGQSLPEYVEVVDFGIRGLDLGYALMEPYAAVILIDATPRGGEPGSLYVFEPDLEELEGTQAESLMIEAHSMVPERVLRWVKSLKGSLPPVRIVGYEPATFGNGADIEVGLSELVRGAVPRAVEVVLSIIEELQTQRGLAKQV